MHAPDGMLDELNAGELTAERLKADGSTRLLTALAVVALFRVTLLTSPSVYPTGTTIYHPDEAWSGYTVLDTPNSQGAVLIDMNGAPVHRWPGVTAVPGPARLLPGGDLIGGSTRRRPHQEAQALVPAAATPV